MSAAAIAAATTSSSKSATSILRRTVALVTGGSSGLGAAATNFLLQHGARVVVADLPQSHKSFVKNVVLNNRADAAVVRKTVVTTGSPPVLTVDDDIIGAPDGSTPDDSDGSTTIIDEGPAVAFSETDVTNSAQVSEALDMAERCFGEPINACVSCAGIGMAKKTLSSKGQPHPLEDFTKTITVNTIGTFNVARLAAERMSHRNRKKKFRRSIDDDDEDEDSDDDDDDDDELLGVVSTGNGGCSDNDLLRGCIINTASIAAYEGQIGQVAYSASKGAVVGMTLPMARDLAQYNIRVMTIAPGLFETPLLDGLPDVVKDELGRSVPCPNRLGRPREFGELVGSILTIPTLNGSVIRLDGALRMPP